MAETRYQRLTRARARRGLSMGMSRCSLWLGEDHLLSVDSTGYMETYKRFYFRDIQAVVLTQTPWWIYWGIALGSVGAVFGAIALFSGEVILASVFGPLAFCFLLALAYDLAAGPTCTCELRTAVQTEELPSLNRVRRTLELLDRLRPLITAAQGQLPAAEISARLQTLPASPDAPVGAVTEAANPLAPDTASAAAGVPEAQPPDSASSTHESGAP